MHLGNKSFIAGLAVTMMCAALLFIQTGCNWLNPDITDYGISVEAVPDGSSHQFSGSFTITNVGELPGSSDVTWEVYRSDDTVVDAGDTLVDSGVISPLSAGGTSNPIQYASSYPLVAGAHDYHFVITVSASDDSEASNDVSISSAVTFNVLFYEGFENTYDESWTTSAFYTLSFDTLSGLSGGSPADGSLYALRQSSASVNSDFWNNAQKVLFGTDITPTYVSFTIRAAQTGSTGGYIMLLGPDPWPGKLNLYMTNTAYFNANGSFVLNQGTYDADTWYKVEIKDIDYVNDTYDVYIDGDLDLENKLVTSGITAFGGISLYNVDAGEFYYDEIIMY